MRLWLAKLLAGDDWPKENALYNHAGSPNLVAWHDFSALQEKYARLKGFSLEQSAIDKTSTTYNKGYSDGLDMGKTMQEQIAVERRAAVLFSAWKDQFIRRRQELIKELSGIE